MERISKKNFIIDVFYALLVLGLIFAGAYLVIKYLFPFVVGIIVALAVQKPALKIAEKVKAKNGNVAALLSFLLYLSVAAIASFLVYRVIVSAIGLADYLPSFFEKMSHKINEIGEKYSYFFERVPKEMRIWIKTLIGEATQNTITSIGGLITDTVSGLVKKLPLLFISGIVTLVASCYIAKDFESLKNFIKSVIGDKFAIKVIRIKKIFLGSVFKMVKGYFVLSIITCAELYIGFLILKINNPLTLAILIAFVDLLPVLGTGVIMVPWTFILALSGNYTLAVGLGILYIITVVVRNFSEPKIIGRQLGVNALFTLVTMFLGLKLLGVLGLILFPIIFIVTVQYYREEIEEGLSV